MADRAARVLVWWKPSLGLNTRPCGLFASSASILSQLSTATMAIPLPFFLRQFPRHVSWFPHMKMCSEEGRGRFLVASQPIQAGETVCASPPYCRYFWSSLIVAPPLVTLLWSLSGRLASPPRAVTGSMKRIVCSHCYRASTNRLPFQCERCHEVSFCSDQCRYQSLEGSPICLPWERRTSHSSLLPRAPIV